MDSDVDHLKGLSPLFQGPNHGLKQFLIVYILYTSTFPHDSEALRADGLILFPPPQEQLKCLRLPRARREVQGRLLVQVLGGQRRPRLQQQLQQLSAAARGQVQRHDAVLRRARHLRPVPEQRPQRLHGGGTVQRRRQSRLLAAALQGALRPRRRLRFM